MMDVMRFNGHDGKSLSTDGDDTNCTLAESPHADTTQSKATGLLKN